MSCKKKQLQNARTDGNVVDKTWDGDTVRSDRQSIRAQI